MTTSISYKISDSLYLVQQQLSKTAPPKPVEVPVDHILVYDCSGSMYYELPKIREQIKKRLPTMLGPKDTLSMVWFSGRGQFGTLLESEPVATGADLQVIQKAVDRWLVPVGMTGFKEPLVEVAALAQRLAKKNHGNVRSLMFFTDGCDNQWTTNDVIKAVEGAAGHVQAATFVEYGYYANRNLLAQMAEKSGGNLIFAEDFHRYEPQFESVLKRKQTGAKRVEVSIKGDTIGGFAYALTGGDLVTFSTEGSKISVPEDLSEVYYLSPSAVGSSGAVPVARSLAATYAAISLFAVRMKPDVVFPLLKATGDVSFIEQFTNCFGKQKYSAFMDAAKAAAFDDKARLTKGYNPNLVPREDAFTVLDVLNLLHQDESARVLLDDMKYTRIGRSRIDATDQLTPEEQQQVTDLTAEMGKTKDAKRLKVLAEQIATITDKPDALKFERKVPVNGLPISNLTFNEDRPNVSFLVKIPGTIDLSKRIDKATVDLTGVPTVFSCMQFRNFTVIKDGLVNIEKLPVVVSEATFNKLKTEGVVDGEATFSDSKGLIQTSGPGTRTVLLDLKALPVINRKQVRELSAKTFFETSYELTKAKAAQKVYKDYAKTLLPEKASQGYVDKYGDEAAAWLKEQGITDYNGFQPPHTTTAPATDVYTGKELKVSLKGLSSLPKVADIKAKIMKTGANGIEWVPNPKLNAPGALMVSAVKEVESFLESDIYRKAADQPAVLQAWLDGQTKASIGKARSLMFQVAQSTFCTVVGQVWFKEFASLDENELTLKVDGNDVACKVEMKEVQIPI